MKKLVIYLLPIMFLLSLSACDINEPHHNYDNVPPAPPTGVQVLNGDQRVDLYWNYNRENDVAGYNVYYAYSYDGKYTLIGSTGNNYFTDYGVSNGVEYYYAVTAYDYNGNESDLSTDVIYATPRPEGFNQSISDYRTNPNMAGYSFSKYSVVAYDSIDADFFFENYNGDYYLDVWDDTDIQDMGTTNDIYDIPEAPTSGWSTTKDAPAIIGHTYVIWTWDNHYAKVRISYMTSNRIVFDWAYQLVKGNRQLKVVQNNGERNPLDKSKLNRNRSSQ
jgi:hypothetical protein